VSCFVLGIGAGPALVDRHPQHIEDKAGAPSATPRRAKTVAWSLKDLTGP
jgi:hypothetical protein